MLTVRFQHRKNEPVHVIKIEESQKDFVEQGQNVLEYDILSITDYDGKQLPFALSFRAWFHRSVQLCNKIAGVSLSDAGDYDAASSYEGGMTPLQFVADHLRTAGFPFPEQFDEDGDEAEQLLILATFHG